MALQLSILTSSTPYTSLPSAAPTTSTSSAQCVVSGHCDTYKYLACPDGVCLCGLDINNNPTCFLNIPCEVSKKCSSDADCSANEACGMKDCCGKGGHCAPRVTGCLDSPPLKDQHWILNVPPCKRTEQSNSTVHEGTDREYSINEKQLVC